MDMVGPLEDAEGFLEDDIFNLLLFGGFLLVLVLSKGEGEE
jgi:hypothetical protein